MQHKDVFSESWISDFVDALNNNQGYRSTAENWQWPLILKQLSSDNKNDRAVFLDIRNGVCEIGRAASGSDFNRADYIITGSEDNWEKLLNGCSSPLSAILKGQLTLEKGSKLKLLNHTESANKMLGIAQQITSGSQPTESSKSEGNPSQRYDALPLDTSRFKTVSGGIDFKTYPMRLFEKSKKLGIWNPSDIDFSQDIKDWRSLKRDEQLLILNLTALFQGGEEAVTRDIMPLMSAMAKLGRLEDEIYLTSFLWEEAKHTEFFQRFLEKITGDLPDLTHFHGPPYKELFEQKLPDAMEQLQYNISRKDVVKASVTYNMVVEGMLAETGYFAYANMLEAHNLMPGLLEGIQLLKRDESRHIAYGIYLISSMLKDAGDWPVVEETMTSLTPLVIQIIDDIFDRYEPIPFNLKKSDFLDFALKQSSLRIQKLQQGLD